MRAQRLVAATAAVGLVSVCCAASISAGSAATSGSTDSVTAVSDPCQQVPQPNQYGSNTTARKNQAATPDPARPCLPRATSGRERLSAATSDKRVPADAGMPSCPHARAHVAECCSARLLSREYQAESWCPGSSELGPDGRTVPREPQRGNLRQTVHLDRSLNASSATAAISCPDPVRHRVLTTARGHPASSKTHGIQAVSTCPERLSRTTTRPAA